MAKTNSTPARGAEGRTAAPDEIDPALRDEATDETDPEADGPPDLAATPGGERGLIRAALRKLGLPEDASPLDLARALLGGAMEVRHVGPPRARHNLVVTLAGKRHRIPAGALIPEGVNHAEIPAGSVIGARR